RVGQDLFRKALTGYWDGCCPVTGNKDLPLLRATHIIPWSECTDDSQRLDVHISGKLRLIALSTILQTVTVFPVPVVPRTRVCWFAALSVSSTGRAYLSVPRTVPVLVWASRALLMLAAKGLTFPCGAFTFF